VTNVTAAEAQLRYRAPATVETSFSNGANVTLGPDDGAEFIAYFPESGTVQLSPDLDGYAEQTAEIDQFDERIAGLWGIVIMSAVTVVLLVGLAFLPNK
jgi:hypothetical protein